jgi:endogenous inhibitor of DNA gyrase (YacG/DUF329 family)
MARKRVLSVRCPTCGKIVLQKEPGFPFCSERCRLIDLGKWASGAYVIPAAGGGEESPAVPSSSEDSTGEAEGSNRRER